MFLQAGQNQVSSYEHLYSIRLRVLHIGDETVSILSQGLIPDAELYSMTLLDFVQKLFMPTIGDCHGRP